jgi:proline racemase
MADRGAEGRTLELLLVHAEGEIGKVLVAGAPAVPGGSIEAMLVHLNEVDDSFRRYCTLEPRGMAQASVNLLLPPERAGSAAGFIVMQPDRCHAMSGSNAICVTTALLESGRVPMAEPTTRLVLDTAAGPVAVEAACRGGRCERVRLEMPWSFVVEDGLVFEVQGVGRVEAAIAFGGVFYLLVEAASVGLRIGPAGSRALVEKGMAILAAAQERWRPVHPERPGVNGLAYLMFMDGERNATIMPPGRVDRSPCGTGSSARLALLHARGEVGAGAETAFRSIIGSRFEAGIVSEGEVAGRQAIRPWISGRGYVYGREELFALPDEPFPTGHAMADTYGPGVAASAAGRPGVSG